MNLRALREYVSLAVKDKVMRHYHIPFNKEGLDGCFVKFLEKDMPINLVDVGASTGQFAAAIESYCGIRNAVLIEPQPKCVVELKARFSNHNYWIEQCAISDRETRAEMDIFNWHYSSSLLPIKGDIHALREKLDLNVRERIEVQVRTLDKMMSVICWSNEFIDLLKVDVQGGELSVFRGAPDTLRRTKMVWTEVCFRQVYEGAALFGEIHTFMSDAGFILSDISQGLRGQDNELLEGDALFMNRELLLKSDHLPSP